MAERKSAVTEGKQAAVEGTAQPEFSKEQLLASARFQDRRDLVDALLENGKRYTIKAVEEAINNYLKGQVK